MTKNILITGGAGFIGSHVVRRFVNNYENYHIYNLDALTYAGNLENLIDIEKKENYTFLKGDITDEVFINKIFKKYKFEQIIHLAAESHVDRSITDPLLFAKTNILGTMVLLNAFKKLWENNWDDKLFYHVSTDEVYGSLNFDDSLFTEKTPYDPRNPYSATKASAEHMVRTWNNTYDLPYIITSSSNNYGPRQHPEKLIPKVIQNAMNDTVTNMYGGGHQIRDWIHVLDHCAAIWSLDEKKVINDKFNIGGGCEVTNMDITKKILDILDKPHSLIGQSDERPGQDQRYGTDFSKLTEKTGWFPGVEFNRGLAETVKWYLD